MTTRIFLFSDIHANLPAFEAIQQAVHQESPDLVVHLGDTIDMGPHPAEVIDGFIDNPDWLLIKGNHEHYIVESNRNGINIEEHRHQAWTRDQLRDDQLEVIHHWPMQIECTIEDIPLRFVHYARQNPPNDNSFVRLFRPTPIALDTHFQPNGRQLICFGHVHHPFQLNGAHTHYVSVASAGPSKPISQTAYVILTLNNGVLQSTQKYQPYNDRPFFEAMEARKVPARLTILRIFYGNRS